MRGRPRKDIDQARLLDIKRTGLSVRKATEAYNSGLSDKEQISKSKMAQVLSGQVAETTNCCPEKVLPLPNSETVQN